MRKAFYFISLWLMASWSAVWLLISAPELASFLEKAAGPINRMDQWSLASDFFTGIGFLYMVWLTGFIVMGFTALFLKPCEKV